MDSKDVYVNLLLNFIDEMQRQGKLTEKDVSDYLTKQKHMAEAKSIVDDMFKGM